MALRSEAENARVTPGEGNRAVDEIEEVFVKYCAIVNGPSLMGLGPSMIGNWMKPFEIAWLKPGPE